MRRHPFGTRQMAFKNMPSPGRFLRRINLQNDPCNFRPIRTLGIGIEEPQISDEVLLIIPRQCVNERRRISYCWGEWRLWHDTSLVGLRQLHTYS